jgi:tetratricopeptide (TPR) repeat protein
VLFDKLFRKPGADRPRPAAAASDPRRTAASATTWWRDPGSSISALVAAGDFAGALQRHDADVPEAVDPAAHAMGRGLVFMAWGRFAESREALTRAHALGSADDLLFRKLGWVSFWTARIEDAERWMRRAVECDGNVWANHFGLAAVLHVQRRLDESIEAQRRALAIDPANVDSLNSIVVCQLDQKRPPDAEATARQVLAIDATQAIAWANLGVALGRQERFDDAREPFETAMRCEAQSGEAVDSYINYCNLLRDMGRNADALAVYEQRLPLQPSVIGHADYAFSLLAAGRLREGWKNNEFRWMKEPFVSLRPSFDRPVWAGQDLQGRTILLRSEQGFGDVIQFIRYAPAVKALGATVLLMVRSGLERLLQSCAGIDRIVSRTEPLPPFDFHIPLMSLPHVFGTELDTVPANVPYLRAEDGLVTRWRDRLGPPKGRRVGIVWAGSPAHPNDALRSIALRLLAPVLQTPGVEFVSLQKGPQTAEADAIAPYVALLNLGPELEDFADTAAVMAELDLVICVDTSVAHLAGALGVRTWLLLPFPAEFRWFGEGVTNVWYPTMRLFRQTSRGDWTPVVRQVREALEQWAATAAPDHRRDGHGANVALPVPRAHVPEALGSPGLSEVAETRWGVVQHFATERLLARSVAYYGEYLEGQVQLLARIVQTGSTIVEAQAGIGAHVLALARYVGVDGHVLAVESRPLFHRVLRQNLASNGIVNVTNFARELGSQPRRPATWRGPVRNDAGRILEPDGATETIDGLRLDRLDLLKVNDTSRALDVLKGSAETLWRLRPILYVAIDDATREDVLAHCREFGYRCWLHASPYFREENFNGRRDDDFDGRRALALLALPEEIEAPAAVSSCEELS